MELLCGGWKLVKLLCYIYRESIWTSALLPLSHAPLPRACMHFAANYCTGAMRCSDCNTRQRVRERAIAAADWEKWPIWRRSSETDVTYFSSLPVHKERRARCHSGVHLPPPPAAHAIYKCWHRRRFADWAAAARVISHRTLTFGENGEEKIEFCLCVATILIKKGVGRRSIARCAHQRRRRFYFVLFRILREVYVCIPATWRASSSQGHPLCSHHCCCCCCLYNHKMLRLILAASTFIRRLRLEIRLVINFCGHYRGHALGSSWVFFLRAVI